MGQTMSSALLAEARRELSNRETITSQRAQIMRAFSVTYDKCKAILDKKIASITEYLNDTIRQDRQQALDHIKPHLAKIKSCIPAIVGAEEPRSGSSMDDDVANACAEIVRRLVKQHFRECHIMRVLGLQPDIDGYDDQQRAIHMNLRDHRVDPTELTQLMATVAEALQQDDEWDEQIQDTVPQRCMLPVAFYAVTELIKLVGWGALTKAYATRAVVRRDPDTLNLVEHFRKGR